MKIIKKDGTIEYFNGRKVRNAVEKAAARVNVTLSDWEMSAIEEAVYNEANKESDFGSKSIRVLDLHGIVKRAIEKVNPTVAESYQNFRDYKTTYAKEFDEIFNNVNDVLFLGDRENANFDSSLVSTKGSLIKGYLTKSLYKNFYLSTEEKFLTKRGDIYIHDLRDMILGCFNCCLFDMATVLKNGFKMSGIQYTEPKSVLSALQVIGDITLVATAQQFGGFTIPEIDKVLLPYLFKTIGRNLDLFKDSVDGLEKASQATQYELNQGFQSLELKLNTVPCSRGDFAFTTLTFGNILSHEEFLAMKLPEQVTYEAAKQAQASICATILKTRMKGHGGISVVFPKLVYLYDAKKHKEDYIQKHVFDLAIKCSSKCMYPDYLSINDGFTPISQVYNHSGVVNSPMGCRAFLSPWKDPETGKYVTVGRCNIGAVSLNLPLIWKVAEHEGRPFFTVLEERMQVIRNFFKKRYAMLAETKCSTNPMAFTQGGLYKGNKKPDDTIGDLTKYMTASFGVTALHELTELATGKSLREDQTFATLVLKFINDKIEEFKKEDGHLYALYGTPAESLAGTQAKQFKEYLESIGEDSSGVPEYFTNSFHMHVSEDITPFEKQDLEFNLFHNVNGGHIQYVRLQNPENLEALKAIVERGLEKGFYQGVNFDSAYCNDCGEHSSNVMFTCPHCGSTNLTVISRVCGYLGYSNVGGSTRMNDAKMAEIKDRVSM